MASKREVLRNKRASRKGTTVQKWARLRRVANEEPKEVAEALTELAEAFGEMGDAVSNLKENLDLIEAPKSAALKIRIATARKYASTFKRIAEENPEVMAGALSEVYHSLDDVAGAVEALAESMGIELSLTPAEEAFAEEGKEEYEGEAPCQGEEPEEVNEEKFEEAEEELHTSEGEDAVEEAEEAIDKEAAGSKDRYSVSNYDTPDREGYYNGTVQEYTSPLKSKKPHIEVKYHGLHGSNGAVYVKVNGKKVFEGTPGEAKTFLRREYGIKYAADKEAGSAEWTTDRDENGEPKAPTKLEIPEAQGASEGNKSARAKLRRRVAAKE